MSAETPTPKLIIGTSTNLYGVRGTVKSELQSPLFVLLTQIDAAVRHGMDLLAVSMAVALPDICGALLADNGKATPDRYKDWCRDHLKVGFDNFAPEDLYSMRCGMLHQGRLRGMKHGINKVVLVPGPGTLTGQDTTGGVTTAIYSTTTFCVDMNRAVVAWYEANHDHPNVKRNIADLMQYRQGTYEVQGTPVIA